MEHPISSVVLAGVVHTEDGLVLCPQGQNSLLEAMRSVPASERQVAAAAFFSAVAFLKSQGGFEAAQQCLDVLGKFIQELDAEARQRLQSALQTERSARRFVAFCGRRGQDADLDATIVAASDFPRIVNIPRRFR